MVPFRVAFITWSQLGTKTVLFLMWIYGSWLAAYDFLLQQCGGVECFQRWWGVVHSSWYDSVLFACQSWNNTDDLSTCTYILPPLTDRWAVAVGSSLSVFAEAFAFAATEVHQWKLGVAWPWPGCVKPLRVCVKAKRRGTINQALGEWPAARGQERERELLALINDRLRTKY